MVEAGVAAAMLTVLARAMVESLADELDAVQVTGQLFDGCVALTVTVAAGDIGKLIGKQGRTARSMRTILYAAGVKYGLRCQLNLIEPEREGADG